MLLIAGGVILDKMVCCICGEHVNKFHGLPHVWKRSFFREHGERLRNTKGMTLPQKECPYCRSHERHRLLWLYVRPRIPIWKGKSILDIGPNGNLGKRLFSNAGLEYFTLEKGSNRTTYNVDICVADKVIARKFDVIICSHVLEHVFDDMQALKSIQNLMSQESELLVQVPIWGDKTVEPTTQSSRERESLNGNSDHHRIYGLDMKERIESVGFVVVKYKPQPDMVKGYGLDGEDFIYIARIASAETIEKMGRTE